MVVLRFLALYLIAGKRTGLSVCWNKKRKPAVYQDETRTQAARTPESLPAPPFLIGWTWARLAEWQQDRLRGVIGERLERRFYLPANRSGRGFATEIGGASWRLSQWRKRRLTRRVQLRVGM
jgi:hypothetical protein